MADKSAIEWTDATWNPVTGCSRVSPGCAHCYAETLSLRYGWSKKPWHPENAQENVVLHPTRLDKPRSWRQPRMVFVNSMSDLFHELVPPAFIASVFETMRECPEHTFQVLTKRPEQAREWFEKWSPAFERFADTAWPLPNVWLGVSIENAGYSWRADVLRDVPAAVRFISAEPLLGSLVNVRPVRSVAFQARRPLDLSAIDWLIVGGESGPQHRPVEPEWVRELHQLAEVSDCAFFFKQWGGRTPKAGGRLLDGLTYDAMPSLRTEPAKVAAGAANGHPGSET